MPIFSIADFLVEMKTYFSGGCTAQMEADISLAMRVVPEGRFDDLLKQLKVDNNSHYGIDVKKINDAINALDPPIRTYYEFPPRPVVCVCCGTGYQYLMMSTERDHLEGVGFDVCPRCGFPADLVVWPKEINKEYYDKYMAQCKERLSPNAKPYFSKVALLQEIKEERDADKKRRMQLVYGAVGKLNFEEDL